LTKKRFGKEILNNIAPKNDFLEKAKTVFSQKKILALETALRVVFAPFS